jgi:hypothetical protein
MTTSLSSVFRNCRREWCADDCGRRILISAWHRVHGHVCSDCYAKAMERAERDEERKALRGYSNEEWERI